MDTHSPTLRTCLPRRSLAVLLGAVAAVMLASSACAPPPPAPGKYPAGTASRVIVYGDSLVTEADAAIRSEVQARLPGWDVVVRSMPGSAQCDWHPQMTADVSLRPAVVVIAFYGNRFTPCTTSRAYPALYGSDARWAYNLWRPHGVDVVFIGVPPSVGDRSSAVADTYSAAARSVGAPFVSANSAFVDAGGVARERLACRPAERGCAGGVVTVRHADRVHLCLVAPPARGCNVISPGVDRYAQVIAGAAAQQVTK